MATASPNIIQRSGSLTTTTLCVAELAWKLGLHGAGYNVSRVFIGAFMLVCGHRALTFLATIPPPRRREDIPARDRRDARQGGRAASCRGGSRGVAGGRRADRGNRSALGFTDPEHTRRAFVKLFGMSPQAVRRLDWSHEYQAETSSQRQV